MRPFSTWCHGSGRKYSSKHIAAPPPPPLPSSSHHHLNYDVMSARPASNDATVNKGVRTSDPDRLPTTPTTTITVSLYAEESGKVYARCARHPGSADVEGGGTR